MRYIALIARHTCKQILLNKAIVLLIVLISLLIVYAGANGLIQYRKAETTRAAYAKMVRDNWENNPDKHPHRMAHYGYIAFRPKSPLSIFDYGLESYTGNAIFLEAHKQNSANFSEASLSSSMLRFGEISIAMILQTLLPLFIFFIGFGCISQDWENGTLKVLLTQNISHRQLFIGKILGLAIVGSILFVPAMLLTAILMVIANTSEWINLLFLLMLYAINLFIYCTIAVTVSSLCKSSKLSLVLLTGLWLLLIIALPKTMQAIANSAYKIPSKAAFENAIEEDILKQGDSHNPNDKHYAALKDSVLKAHKVDSIQQLKFNYSGFQMAEGERISATIYNKHLQQLLNTYKQQNSLLALAGFVSPYLGMRHISMVLCNTDFYTYTHFQAQAEQYRYNLAQHMNALQMKLIPNEKLPDTVKNYSINHKHWKEFEGFAYQKPSRQKTVGSEKTALIAILFWTLVLGVAINFFGKKFKAV